jgi:hypothetical protein
MARLINRIKWGPTDALDKDILFAEKWIEPIDIETCLSDEKWLITGAKGSGKSAIRKALTDVHNDRYFLVSAFDFDRLEIEAIISNIQSICSTLQVNDLGVVSRFWQYTIIEQFCHILARKNPSVYQGINDKFPHKSKRHGMSGTLLMLAEKMFTRISVATGAMQRRREADPDLVRLAMSSGLPAELLMNLTNFPIDQAFLESKDALFRALDNNGHRVMLILDGLDRVPINISDPKRYQLIFDGLIDAIFRIRKDHDISENLLVKAFIPDDRYIGSDHRDSDKIHSIQKSIRWNERGIKQFLYKRIILNDDISGRKFESTWSKIFPKNVKNEFYQLEEDSFDYILRHTMYRPRQVQNHLTYLAEHIGDDDNIRRKIPQLIAESCVAMAGDFINEFRIDHPNLDYFLGAFRGHKNVMPFSQFKGIVSNSLSRFNLGNDDRSVDAKIDKLYLMGLFGILEVFAGNDKFSGRYCPPTKGERYFFDFHYKNPRNRVSTSLDVEVMIGIHPIFFDTYGMKPSDDFIVG